MSALASRRGSPSSTPSIDSRVARRPSRVARRPSPLALTLTLILRRYTLLASLLVLFQAFHGLAVALVYKYADGIVQGSPTPTPSPSPSPSPPPSPSPRYADAIVKNFANSSVMAILIIISYTFFGLQTTLHSWLGIVIVLTTTYCYMNIALRMPAEKVLATRTPIPTPSLTWRIPA